MLKLLLSKVQFGFFILLCLVFLGFEYSRLGDLHIYLSAANDVFKEGSIYKNLYGKMLFFYLGNPFLTLILYPFSLLPFTSIALLFKLLNIILLFRIWNLLLKYLPTKHFSQKKHSLFLSTVFLACFFLIYSNLHMVQFTILLLYLSLETLYQVIDRERPFLGALILSFAIGVKLTPIVLIPYLIYRNQIKATVYTILFCGFYFYLPSIVLGIDKAQQLWSDWWSLIEPVSKEQIFDTNNRKNHGISALLSTLFLSDLTDNVVHLTNRRYLIGLSENTVQWLILSARIFLASFTLYFLRNKPLNRQPNLLSRVWELSYLFLVIPLFFPQQRIYNFIFLLPSVSYLSFQLLFNNQYINYSKLKATLFSLILIVLNLELILGQFRKYYWHYKTITYATLLLLILLVIVKPKKEKLIEI